MSVSLRVATYNIGVPGGPDNLNSLDLSDDERAVEETNAADRLAAFADVILLQEAYESERPFLQQLRTRGFHYISLAGDTAIASRVPMNDVVTRNRMSESFPEKNGAQGQDISAVTFKVNKVKIAMASMHNWGFNLYHRDASDEDKSGVYRADRENKPRSVIYTQETLDLLESENAHVSIIGGDLNNNRDNYLETFEMFESAGFETHEPSEPTNKNPKQPDYLDRVIDYIFTASPAKRELYFGSFSSKISSFFSGIIKDRVWTSDAYIPPGFDFNVGGSCSDHKPVIITVIYKRSLLSRIFS